MAHFSVKQRRPFKNSFCPSLRHRRQTASRCLANFYSPFTKLTNTFVFPLNIPAFTAMHRLKPVLPKSHAAALWRTAAVVRHRRNVADEHDVQSCGRQRTDSRFAPRAGALYPHFHALHAVLIARYARGSQRSLLRSVRRALARTLKTDGAGRGPAHGAAVGVGDSNLRVVERRGHIHEAVWDYTALALLLEFLLPLSRGRFCRRCAFRRSRCSLWFFCHDSLRSFFSEIQNPRKDGLPMR